MDHIELLIMEEHLELRTTPTFLQQIIRATKMALEEQTNS